ncbi:MAG: protocatechuate dioxygenase [Gammaproteobacteria bacterium]|jgi:protocatechuate 3,4-dioxygenase beta subunit
MTGIGAVSVFRPLATFAQQTRGCVLTIDSGEGPFYFDPTLVRSDIADGHAGAPLVMAIEVVSADGCAALENARVDVWHANGTGLYSGYEAQPGVGGGVATDIRGETFLRGTQFTDAAGNVSFDTIYPSWYGGRTPHIHFKVFLSEREVIAGQIFFPDEINDEVFSTWDPYRQHVDRRTVFNDNDMFLVDGTLQGAIADTWRSSDGYSAVATIAVAG